MGVKSEEVRPATATGRDIFREVNQQIAELAVRFQAQGDPALTVRFICECPDQACVEPVRITLAAYERVVSAEPPRYLVSAIHEAGNDVVLVEAHPDYRLVELRESRRDA